MFPFETLNLTVINVFSNKRHCNVIAMHCNAEQTADTSVVNLIISFHPIGDLLTQKSIHQLGMKSV